MDQVSQFHNDFKSVWYIPTWSEVILLIFPQALRCIQRYKEWSSSSLHDAPSSMAYPIYLGIIKANNLKYYQNRPWRICFGLDVKDCKLKSRFSRIFNFFFQIWIAKLFCENQRSFIMFNYILKVFLTKVSRPSE